MVIVNRKLAKEMPINSLVKYTAFRNSKPWLVLSGPRTTVWGTQMDFQTEHGERITDTPECYIPFA